MFESFNANTNLAPRLKNILDLIPENTQRLVDVGCDHGKLSKAFLLSRERAEALLIDLREKPLAKAKKNLSSIPEKKKTFSLSSGLLDWEVQANDCIVIAGLGAKEIINILAEKYQQILSNNSMTNYEQDVFIIIQAMRNQENVRQFFRENNFTCLIQSLVQDKRFTYSIELYKLNFAKIKIAPKLQVTNSLEDFLAKPLFDKLTSEKAYDNSQKLITDNRNIKQYVLRQYRIIKQESLSLDAKLLKGREETLSKLEKIIKLVIN